MVGPLHNITYAWDGISNRYKYCIMSENQLIQLYKFVCTLPLQNIIINLRSKPLFSRL